MLRWILGGLAAFLGVAGCQQPRHAAEPARTVNTLQGPIKVTQVLDEEYGDGDEVEAPAEALRAATGDTYSGTARRDVKTSIYHGPNKKTFSTLDRLLSWLPDDDTKMWNRQPRISNAANSTRVSEEEWLVTVDAYLYAAKHEPDNDYHLILGRAPGKPKQFMTIEISGLPRSNHTDFTALKKARDEFKSFFADDMPSKRGYDIYEEPIPVRVTGCLFFDTSHHAGQVGPSALGKKPKTTWEIHPVTEIVFNPEDN